MNFRMIKYILGWILVFETLFLLIPLITAAVYGESCITAILLSIAVCLASGGLLILKKPENTELYSREGFVIVSMSWIILSLFGALPFFFSGAIPNFIDALFETVSGFTTTGASILSEVESMPKAMLMWRSFTHWVGGMGVLVFIMAFIPLSGGQNIHIMKAESPGPSVSKLVPRVKTTALILYSIYFVLTLTEFVLLLFGGMSVFEALNTALATAGTGGFGIKNDSLGGYSPYIQIVVTVFMVMFAINFSSYYFIISGKLKEAFNKEVRVFLMIVLSAIAIITFNVRGLFGSIGEALRHVSFTVASIISTTGFSTVDFDIWPELSKTIIVLLMLVGGCAGSTGGGIKVTRIIILVKGLAKELEVMIHPKQLKKITVDSKPIEHEIVRSVNSYMVCYVLLFMASALIISIDGHDLITNFTAVSAAVNNIGPGLELVGPTRNFGFFSPVSKLVLIFDMLAGRLELFPMLLLFSRATWKK
ncbi:MAG: TrkH family potassium uptake protein [Oscillospiraceae bacterium]|nr:TrkH family potassium uptake protein [Oscillospiraceae bacterium]MDY3792438.1 TrkH family potassium uptake protein [Oscillospiraceae bacterium]MDY6208375.1 TrkH family potassium uptake protein [Oscillospiraceae bacterium]